jgi:hypothetical protein
MRNFVAAMLLFGITVPTSAQDLKPGTPEWDRRFAELREKGEELRKKNSRSSSRSSRSSTLKSSSSFDSRSGSSKSEAERKKELDEIRREREQKEIGALPAKYRKSYADALHPAAFDHSNTPSVETTVKHLQQVMDSATRLDEVIPYLSASFRQRYILLLAGQNYGSGRHTPEEELAHYKQFFRTITSYESSSGSDNKNFAYGYVWTEDKSTVLYQLEFVGEGRLWRLNGWKPQLTRQ